MKPRPSPTAAAMAAVTLATALHHQHPIDGLRDAALYPPAARHPDDIKEDPIERGPPHLTVTEVRPAVMLDDSMFYPAVHEAPWTPQPYISRTPLALVAAGE